jgi:hypothetical protein
VNLVLAVLCAIVLGLVGVYDAWAVFSGQDAMTVSEIFRAWIRQWPIIAFAAGMLAMHLLDSCGKDR